MLTNLEIEKQIKEGNIVITPFDKKLLNPNSYNVTLNNKLLVYDGGVLDVKKHNPTREIIIPETGLQLQPGELYLGSINEYTETYNLIPGIDGRSSIGRLGIFIHVTAGFGDIGFNGVWTLEITVVKPIIIYPNIEIGQLYYEPITGEVGHTYNGKYQNAKEAQASRIYTELV